MKSIHLLRVNTTKHSRHAKSFAYKKRQDCVTVFFFRFVSFFFLIIVVKCIIHGVQRPRCYLFLGSGETNGLQGQGEKEQEKS